MASFRRSLFPEIWHTPTTDSVHKKKKQQQQQQQQKNKTEKGYVVINVHSVMVCVFKLR